MERYPGFNEDTSVLRLSYPKEDIIVPQREMVPP